LTTISPGWRVSSVHAEKRRDTRAGLRLRKYHTSQNILNSRLARE
jgi:hypothetical protein